MPIQDEHKLEGVDSSPQTTEAGTSDSFSLSEFHTRTRVFGDEGIVETDEDYLLSSRMQRRVAEERGPSIEEHYEPSFDVRAKLGYPIQARTGQLTDLPEPCEIVAPLSATLRGRATSPTFAEESIAIEALSTLLWAAGGVIGGRDSTRRVTASAGALNPLDTYAYVNRGTTLERGLYQYDPFHHRLVKFEQSAPPSGHGWAVDVPGAFIFDKTASSAACVILFAGIFARNRTKYGLRALRYTLIEAGACAQNVALFADAIGLTTCQLSGYYDPEIDSLLGFDGVGESVIHAIAIGSRP